MQSERLVALDVGERRIGVAKADSSILLAIPVTTVAVNGQELAAIKEIADEYAATKIIVGLPRNQKGELTAQSAYVQQFVENMSSVITLPVEYQDESLTSVMAEENLKATNRSYTKEDIDAAAASLILKDYLEAHYAKPFAA